MIKLSVIVPAYNEAAILWEMAECLGRHLDDIIGPGAWQFVIVENGSVDATPQIVDRIVATWPATIALRLPRADYGEALFSGLQLAHGAWIYIINVDFWDAVMVRWCWQHRGRYDLVLGSKRADPSLNRQHGYRKLLSWGYNSILRLAFGFAGCDTHGQKFLHLPSLRPTIDQCVMRRGQFDTEMTLRAQRAGLRIAEVPVPVTEIRAPRNLMAAKIYHEFVDLFRLRGAMKSLPRDQPVRYQRWTRQDLLEANSPDGAGAKKVIRK